MSRFVTLKDVAEKAGTTVGTVSYVLNNKKGRYISDDLRQRVLVAASELNYIKCNGASSLKGMDRKLIGILIPQFENQFFTRICLAAEEVFVQHGYDLIICDTFDEPGREKAIIHRLLSQRVDGIIITPTVDGAENTKIARDVGMNMVVVDRPLEGLEGLPITMDADLRADDTSGAADIGRSSTSAGSPGLPISIPERPGFAMLLLQIPKSTHIMQNSLLNQDSLKRRRLLMITPMPQRSSMASIFRQRAV